MYNLQKVKSPLFDPFLAFFMTPNFKLNFMCFLNVRLNL
jgi:hypothetical protein